MLQPFYTKQFNKDIRKIERSGSKDIEKLKAVIRELTEEKQLNPSHRDHALKGGFKDRRECHIEPDWLLIYQADKKKMVIIFERTGSHSELFR